MQHKNNQRDPKPGSKHARVMIVQPQYALIDNWKAEVPGTLRTTLLTLVLISTHKGAAAGSE